MTISTTIIKNSYDGDGSQTVFPYSFKLLAEGDIEVIIRAADGTETVKTIATQYTVSGVGSDSGGNVTCLFTPTATEKVILRRATNQTQTLDLVENDPFTADSVEGAFDRAIAITQELQEQINRSIKLSPTNTITSTEFTVGAADRANKVLAFDATGELSIAQSLGDYQGNWVTAKYYNQRDIIKDTTNDNIYLCVTAHTSTGSLPLSSNADIAKWVLIVDAAAASAAIAAAEAARDIAVANAAQTTIDAATAASEAGNAAQSAATATTQAGIATSAQGVAVANAAQAVASAGASAQSATDAAASAASAAASSGGGVVKATAADTNANYLNDKFVLGVGLKKDIINAGGNEQLQITSNAIAYAIALGG